jgi:rubrerythrin
MKKTLSIISALIFLSGLTTFAATADKTIANLKDAFKGESTASAKYAAYAEQAKKEGFIPIAIMFEATSKAEAIHAANHKTVLEKMGQKVDPVTPVFTVQTTQENLTDALKGESYEIATMYPGFIATAKSDDAKGAVKSFGWAMDTEKKHQALYKNAIEALKNKKESSLSKIYWVCPKCGNTFDIAKPAGECGFCGTKADNYIKFDK